MSVVTTRQKQFIVFRLVREGAEINRSDKVLTTVHLYPYKYSKELVNA